MTRAVVGDGASAQRAVLSAAGRCVRSADVGAAADRGDRDGRNPQSAVLPTSCDPFGIPSTSHWTGAAIIVQ